MVSEADHLRSAVKDAMSGIRRTKFAPWKFYSRGSRFEPHGDNLIDGLAAVEIIQKSCPSNGFDPATFFDGDESYTITVEGNITKIYTKSTIGTIRSLGESSCDQLVSQCGPCLCHNQQRILLTQRQKP